MLDSASGERSPSPEEDSAMEKVATLKQVPNRKATASNAQELPVSSAIGVDPHCDLPHG